MEATRPVPRSAARPTGRPAYRLTRDRVTALLMLAPSALAIGVFVYGFIAWTGFVSLTQWSGILANLRFNGLENYVSIFNTGRFQTDIRNTIVFTSLFVVLTLLLGFVLAGMPAALAIPSISRALTQSPGKKLVNTAPARSSTASRPASAGPSRNRDTTPMATMKTVWTTASLMPDRMMNGTSVWLRPAEGCTAELMCAPGEGRRTA